MVGNPDFWDYLRSFILSFGLIIEAIISIFFYLMNKKQKNIYFRIFSSIHGFVSSLLFLIAIIILKIGKSNADFIMPFQIAFLIPISSILISFFWFKGNKFCHLLHLFTIVCIIFFWFIGTMAISNQWL